MAEISLAVVTRDEVISCFRETPREPRASGPAPDRVTPSAKSSSVSQDFTDSGYSSPDDPTVSDSQVRVQDSKQPRPKGIPVKLGGQNLFRFKGTPSKQTNDRFNYVIDQIEPLLLARLKKTGSRVGPMAFRTMILGTNEEDAGEYIVVLCPKKLLETVNDFFDKTKIIKELCEPTEQTPRLSIIVEGREPRLTAKLLRSLLSIDHSHVDSNSWVTKKEPKICGCSLRLTGNQKNGKTATFGGMIKVMDTAGESKLYGMTVGHVFNEDKTTSSEETSLESCNRASLAKSKLELGYGHEVWEEFRTCQVLKKDESQEEGPDFDWALVESDGFLLLGPNNNMRYSLTTDSGTFLGDEPYQEVEMIAGTDETRPGLLARGSARFWSGTAGASTPAYILTLEEGEVGEGDSGAWVVGALSHEVFGHTVAVDMFGDAYVLPMDQTFADIQRSLGAESVQLASLQDWTSTRSPNKRPFEQQSPKVGLIEGESGHSKRRKSSPVQAESPTMMSDEEVVTMDIAIAHAAPPDSAYGSAHVTPQSIDCPSTFGTSVFTSIDENWSYGCSPPLTSTSIWGDMSTMGDLPEEILFEELFHSEIALPETSTEGKRRGSSS
ncbi:hypothetical protein BDP55DRAFT_626543 [Colletotrichum godetiae]|uniref:Uncharacterized protein n=1 Tax=Colletotrichum godetiae TaxID=1209918 RepID=A0AAJ0F1P2_9PEZI|nr:uncharacterized protein BDP55DRAFT_626543 [Colletotrichum godetiae]KAK1699854.1 hypothetical protein BDP55DRAFT_626543 [Colletotrichum godetiae]